MTVLLVVSQYFVPLSLPIFRWHYSTRTRLRILGAAGNVESNRIRKTGVTSASATILSGSAKRLVLRFGVTSLWVVTGPQLQISVVMQSAP